MADLDRLFGRTRSGTAPDQGLGGVLRLGGLYYNAKWNFTRVLNDVYANPTGYRCVNTIADDFCRPPWAIYTDGLLNTPVADSKATELLAVLNGSAAQTGDTEVACRHRLSQMANLIRTASPDCQWVWL